MFFQYPILISILCCQHLFVKGFVTLARTRNEKSKGVSQTTWNSVLTFLRRNNALKDHKFFMNSYRGRFPPYGYRVRLSEKVITRMVWSTLSDKRKDKNFEEYLPTS